MVPFSAAQPILVTGASGFIASHIVSRLLEQGARVRGTVRRLGAEKDLAHLRQLPGAAERLELVEGDLLTAGAFDGAARGCAQVLHTASPYALDAKDPQKDLVDPAVIGTRHVLEACARAGGVKRVVVTSSSAAVTDEPEGDHVLTEEDWNVKSTLQRNPYYLSKTLAEREAWAFVEKHRPSFDLVAINPFFVIGPSLSPGLNTSNQVLVDLLAGVYPGIMNLNWGLVDVRDVAAAHVAALLTPAAHGRYLCAAEPVTMRNLVELLAKQGHGEGAKLPRMGLDSRIGDFVVRLSSYLQPRGVGSYLRTNVGRALAFDNAKIRRGLGLRFRAVADTVNDTIRDLKRWGHLKTAGA